MYFTRGLCKRVKLNNDIEDRDLLEWDRSMQTVHYNRYLCLMNMRYPGFCIRTKKHLNIKIEEWNEIAESMKDDFDGELIKKLVPEAYLEPSICSYHKIMQYESDLFKLNKIYGCIRLNPIQAIDFIDR